MRLTRSVAYAVSILLALAAEGGKAPMTAARIARGGRFPPRFLYRILRRLVDARLLKAVSGPGGGYKLARRSPRINMLHIVTAVEGAEAPRALRAVSRRHDGAVRLINALVRQSNTVFEQKLAATSLEMLALQASASPRPSVRKRRSKRDRITTTQRGARPSRSPRSRSR